MKSVFAVDLQEYLTEPSAERFMQLQDLVSGSPAYAPYSGELNRGHRLLNEGLFGEVRDYLKSVLPNWILNPRIHHMLSFAYHKLGEEKPARLEYTLSMAMVKGILSTGNGSEAQPYRVLHTEDEYDILRHLGKRSEMQALANRGDRHYDLQRCDDGSEIWFDVTAPLAHMQRQLQKTV